MPAFHRIEELPPLVGQTVLTRGWVMTTRSSGKIGFVTLRDGTGYLQVVLSKKDVPEAAWEAFGGLTQETSVEVTGTIRADARAPGGVELTAADLTIIGLSRDFPITPKEHGTAFLFEHRHLWLRSRLQVAIARVRAEVVQAIRDFFYERHFVLVDTPILTGAIGEHAGTLFATEYFDRARASGSGPGDPRFLFRAPFRTGGHAHSLGSDRRARRDALRHRVLRSRQGVPRPDGPAVRRGRGRGARQGVLLRPHVPRREIEDPAAPDRVLDGGARGGLERLRREHAAAGGLRRLHRDSLSRATQSGARRAGAERETPRGRAAAVPAHLVYRRGREAQNARQRHRVGARPGGRGGDPARAAVRPAGDGVQLSQGREGLLYEGEPGRPAHRPQQRHARARGVR